MKHPSTYFLKKHTTKHPLQGLFMLHLACIWTAMLTLNTELSSDRGMVVAALLVMLSLTISEVIAPAIVKMQKVPAKRRTSPALAAAVFVRTAASRITTLWTVIITGLAAACYRAVSTDNADLLILGIVSTIGAHLVRVLLAYRKAHKAEQKRKKRTPLP